ncbi:MAG: hypothetical protein SP1CHLAM54_14130 [Chlamydiia bacterium]|nr:hypothetical protein [Chlamydiia bacterium]MCH9616305.1 hypothetical protein [Chlamydiia bacterium]MCH9629709.1 hypothetical protein [Chlamydiia bacterium]
MKRLFALPLLLAGCAQTTAQKEKEHQTEIAFQQVRSEIEDLKHDLNTYEIEHHILEGKMSDVEASIAGANQSQIEDLSKELDGLKKAFKQIGKRQNEILADIRQLSAHANETTTALSQYKSKITEIEKQNRAQSYVVQAGDTLDKIARRFGTTVDELRSNNQIKDDLIIVGTEINIP